MANNNKMFNEADIGMVTRDIPYDTRGTRIRAKRPITIAIESLEAGESLLSKHHESSTLTRIRKQFPDRTYYRRTDPDTKLTRIWRVS